MGRFYAQTIAGLGAPLSSWPLPTRIRGHGRDSGRAKGRTNLRRATRGAGCADVDAVVIATPTGTHAELLIAAAQAGKAIFCEALAVIARANAGPW